MVTNDTTGEHVCDLLCPVRDLLRGAPSFVDPEDTLRVAAQAMAGQKTGAVIVLGPDGPTSIVTEQDIVRALADQADRSLSSDLRHFLTTPSVDPPLP